MPLLPEQAKQSLKHGDWSLLNQYLVQLLEGIAPVAAELEAASAPTVALQLALQVLEVGDFQAQWEAAKFFPVFGEAAIAPLIALLQDVSAEFETRWFAARILGGLTHPAVIPALVQVMQTTQEADLATIAAEALAQQGKAAIPAVVELLSQPATCRLAVQTLAQIRHSETIEPLARVAEAADAELRSQAIEALSSFHDPRVLPILLAAIEDLAVPVRRAAIRGLAVRPDLAHSANGVAAIRDRLWDVNLSVCQAAAIALGRLGTAEEIAALAVVLTALSTPLPLQLEVVRSLAWADNGAALDTLEQAIAVLAQTDQPPALYLEIIQVLGRWSNPDLKPQAARILTQMWQHDSIRFGEPSLRQALALALGQLKQVEFLEVLLALHADADEGVRLHAMSALKQLGSPPVWQQLAAIAEHDNLPDLQRQAIVTLLQERRASETPSEEKESQSPNLL